MKKKFLTWIGHKQKGLCPELKKIPYKGQKQILEGLEKTLPAHFQEVGYLESFSFIKMHHKVSPTVIYVHMYIYHIAYILCLIALESQ